MEVVLVVLRLHPMEEGSNPTMMNARLSKDECIQRPDRRDRANEGETEGRRNGWRVDRRSHLARMRTNTKWTKWDKSNTGKRGTETASEEQLDNLRRQYDSSKRRRTHQHLLLLHLCLESLESGDSQVRLETVLLQWSGHVDDDIQSSALDVLSEIDRRESRYIEEVLKWYRDEDIRDLKKSQVNELLESMTSLDVKICEINENDVMDDKINQNTVTDAKKACVWWDSRKTVRVYEEDMKLFLNETSCFLLRQVRTRSHFFVKEGRSTLEVSFLLLWHKVKWSCREALWGTDISIEYLGIDSGVSSRKLRNVEMNTRAMWKRRVDVVRKHHLSQGLYLRKVRRNSSMCT